MAHTSQDIYSYNLERVRGLGLFNLVTVVMYEQDIGPRAAVAQIGAWHDGIVAEFLAARDELAQLSRRWGDSVHRQVEFYVNGLGRWVRGSDDWHFEGQRHFGTDGLRIQREREVMMLPRVGVPSARAGLPPPDDDNRVRGMMEQSAVAGLNIMTKAYKRLTRL